MPRLLVKIPSGYEPERQYALKTVLDSFLGLSFESEVHAGADVILSMPGRAGTLTFPDVLFRTPKADWLKASSLPAMPLPTWLVDPALRSPLCEESLPVFFGATRNGVYFSRSGTDTYCGVDVFGSAFFFLTRYEELALDEKDSHGRFPASASLLTKAGCLHRPLLDEMVEILRRLLTMVFPDLNTVTGQYAVELSHDVDFPAYFFQKSTKRLVIDCAREILKHGRLDVAWRQLESFVARSPRRDLYYTFDFLLAESERRRLPSTYYFMAGVTDPRFDGPYYLNEGWAKELIHTVASKGHRVGLHPSYETFLDPAAIRAEVGRLQAVCSEIPEPKIAIRDSRQHFLRWRYPDTWRHLEAAGIATDASLGFPDHVGFRAGTCRSFATFDSVERRPLALRAIPLIAMDVTLTSYMKLERAEILATVEKLASKCRQAGGKFSLLWHNSSLLTPSAKKLYTDTLDRLASLA